MIHTDGVSAAVVGLMEDTKKCKRKLEELKNFANPSHGEIQIVETEITISKRTLQSVGVSMDSPNWEIIVVSLQAMPTSHA